MGKIAIAVAGMLAASALAGGCRQASGMAADGRYRHEGLRFSVTVPEGWTLTELGGDLAVELRGPAVGEREHATVHVFSRRELGDVDVERTADEVAELMRGRLSGAIAAVAGETGETAADRATVSRSSGDLGGLAASRLVRPVKVGAVLMRQELLVAARGRRVWALVVTVPDVADESVVAEAAGIGSSFEVW